MAESVNIQMKKHINAPTPQNTPSTSTMQAQMNQVKTSNMESIPEDSATKDYAEKAGGSMLDMIQNRLINLTDASTGFVESLPTSVQNRLAGLKALQIEQNQIDALFQKEVLELERKYLEKYRPLYARRSKIVAGDEEPTQDEITAGRDADELLASTLGNTSITEEKSSGADSEETNDIKGIPNFWLRAMKNMSSLAEVITVKDEDALAFLRDIRMSYLENSPGFKLEFDFAPNPFFTNSTLSKTYFYQSEAGYTGDFVYDHAEGDQIDWLEGKNLTMKTESKKQRNKNTKQTRIIKKLVPTDSFFNFFSPPQVKPDDDQDDNSEIDHKLEVDYNIGDDIKEKLIFRAVDWYTGTASIYENLEGFEDYADYDVEDDSEYDDNDIAHQDDDDDESDEEAKKPKPDNQECHAQ